MTRALAIVVFLWSSAALAQPAGAQAEVLFRQARDLSLERGDRAGASVALVPTATGVALHGRF